MKSNNLTIKQEAFCQAFVRLGDKSAAYREAYSSSNMKPQTIHVRASKLTNEYKISTRIDLIRAEISERNKITIDELVQNLAGMVRFDPASVYDEFGALKSIHEMPKEARQMISELNIDEIKGFVNGESVIVGQTKKIKLFDKLGAIEKLMKHLGGYSKDNTQKQPIVNVAVTDISDLDSINDRIAKLVAKATQGQ